MPGEAVVDGTCGVSKPRYALVAAAAEIVLSGNSTVVERITLPQRLGECAR